MPIPTVAEVKKAWVDSAPGASAKYVAGCARVTENPAAAAAASVDLWQAAVTSARARARYVRGLAKVTLEGWKKSVVDKGAAAFTNGIRASADKYAVAMGPVLSHMGPIQEHIKTMPKTTLAENIARANYWMEHMATYGAIE